MKSKRVWWIALAATVSALALCVGGLTAAGWAFNRLRPTPEPTKVPVQFGYCGAQLNTLCVVSFGQDVFGKTVVNLYVPRQTYPPFYMKVIRVSGESVYACEANQDVITSVYCSGEALNLGDGIELQLLAELDDRLLAQGVFSLTAFRVATPVPEPTQSEAASSPKTGATPTPRSGNPTQPSPSGRDSPQTLTPTSSSSYPYP
ncbi:MAG: hypothetical protein HXY38_08275 [Chloroflexi bacterium]|nr:hypothetical protein [Chloroflexota bacterium]